MLSNEAVPRKPFRARSVCELPHIADKNPPDSRHDTQIYPVWAMMLIAGFSSVGPRVNHFCNAPNRALSRQGLRADCILVNCRLYSLRNMMNLKKIALGLFVVTTSLGVALPASAITTNILISGTTIDVQCTDDVAPFSDPVCNGMTAGSLTLSGNEVIGGSAGTLSGSAADLYEIGNSSDANEAQAFDILLDGVDDDDFVGTDGTQTDTGSTNFFSFSSNASFIAFAIGGGQLDGKHFFLSLLSPGTINIEFDKYGQTGGGLSHYTEFGASPVPVPSAVWLFGTALIGFVGISRRTRV